MKFRISLFILLITLLFVLRQGIAKATNPTASWYSVKSSFKEGNNAVMANGKKLNDEKFTCASWDYPFGTVLEVINLENSKKVFVKVTDRGPNKRLYRKGRIIDLSMRAFRSIANLDKGVIEIKIVSIKKPFSF